MSINYHRLYLDSVFALAETLVIKSEYSALRINEQLSLRYGAQAVDSSAPSTWKYYLNLCGEYHSTDAPLMVRSLDTLQNIAFTKENLATNTATRQAYSYGNRFYREMVAQYPDQEMLILGILYPCEMTTLLAAPDLSVVNYPEAYVEENETQLIGEINTWLSHFNARWNVEAFTLTDELYGASLLGVMYAQLVPLIITLRLKACKTPQAHSYHVQQYLASHGMLDVYLQQMTPKQALFFYRNVAYIERNSGKAATLAWLTEKVLTDRSLPLSEYQMRHNTQAMPSSLLPSISFTARHLNNVDSRDQAGISTGVVLTKESPLAPGNPDVIQIRGRDIEDRLKYSRRAVAKTKVLESSLAQSSDNSSASLQDTALAFWGYSAATNRYNVYIRIKHPQTGQELTLSTLQAYHYFFYAYMQVNSLPLQTVPSIYASHIPSNPQPTLAALMGAVDTKYVSQAQVQALVALTPAPSSFSNVGSFTEGCNTLFQASLQQSWQVALVEHFYSRGLLYNAYTQLYSDYVLTTADTGKDIKAYLKPFDVPVDGLSTLEWEQIYRDLFEACTGISIDTELASSNVQRSMVKLLSQLSSYSVQFVSELSGQSIKSLNWAAIRMGDATGSARAYFELLTTIVDVLDSQVNAHMSMPVNVPTVNLQAGWNLTPLDIADQFVQAQVETAPLQDRVRLQVGVDVGRFDFGDSPFPEGISYSIENVPSFAYFNAMSAEDKAQIKDIYTSAYRALLTAPTQVNLDDIVVQNGFALSWVNTNKTTLASWGTFWGPQRMRYFSDETVIVVIPGIWLLQGDVETDAAEPSMGNQLFSLFQYQTGASQTITLEENTWSGGNFVGFTFEQGTTPTDRVMTSLTQVLPAAQFTINRIAPVANMPQAFKAYPVITNLQFTGAMHLYQFSFTTKLDNFTIPSFASVTRVSSITLGRTATRIALPSITYRTGQFRGPQMVSRFSVFSITLLAQRFLATGPSLNGYGAITMNAVHEVEPIDTVNSSGGVQFSTTVQTASLGFASDQLDIEIVDFATLMTQV